jgi:hypothetical protein
MTKKKKPKDTIEEQPDQTEIVQDEPAETEPAETEPAETEPETSTPTCASIPSTSMPSVDPQQEEPTEQDEAPAASERDKAPAASERGKQKYSFPTVSLCPRCHGRQTRAVSTQKNVQYRKCLAPICQRRYHVFGTRVAGKPKKGES